MRHGIPTAEQGLIRHLQGRPLLAWSLLVALIGLPPLAALSLAFLPGELWTWLSVGGLFLGFLFLGNFLESLWSLCLGRRLAVPRPLLLGLLSLTGAFALLLILLPSPLPGRLAAALTILFCLVFALALNLPTWEWTPTGSQPGPSLRERPLGKGILLTLLLVLGGLELWTSTHPDAGQQLVGGTRLTPYNFTGASGETITKLPDGTYLIIGGLGPDGCASADIQRSAGLDLSSGLPQQPYAKVGSLMTPRAGHTATLSDDGKLWVLGGVTGCNKTPLTSVEVVDPARLPGVSGLSYSLDKAAG